MVPPTQNGEAPKCGPLQDFASGDRLRAFSRGADHAGQDLDLLGLHARLRGAVLATTAHPDEEHAQQDQHRPTCGM